MLGCGEAQVAIKIAGRNNNNLRYVDDTTLMAESELKSLLMKVKEESKKSWLKYQHLFSSLAPTKEELWA